MDGTLLMWERVPVRGGDEDEDDENPGGKFVQPKFMPTGPIKNPIAKGKPMWD